MPPIEHCTMVSNGTDGIPYTLILGTTAYCQKMERNLDTALKKIAQHLEPTLTVKDPNCSLSSHLCQAQKQLKQARKDAAEHRKKHLEALLNQAIAVNQQKKLKALKYMICAEWNHQCYT